ncbi:L,D-transpeptidase family protein [Roseomonas terrae]|jgi:L,D-peptidoglycan transpeptidase YkuD (ErfK/YbiS/YcfS/YnhG family)|uniref:L,D-transpeptidase family protein n=1 Tax=Neoroseomonas terrae TaxID=424799 RepID=A0ABS5ENR3_9PROT|nr:L,D-transpeptidase family protein [Neoroseomonas terrae]MBR0652683.1 L,D-transpeptidase family protein [Neoroseomonas terrae]
MSGTAIVTPDALLRFRGQTLRCAIGAGGIRSDKREGDGATPVGLLPIRRLLWRADRGPRPGGAIPAEPIAPEDGWCDDVGDPAYNTRIRLPHGARHERLWRDDTVYDVIGVLGWNDAPVVRGRGSAIFLHLARPGLPPTEGCVALPEAELRRLLSEGMAALEIRG